MPGSAVTSKLDPFGLDIPSGVKVILSEAKDPCNLLGPGNVTEVPRFAQEDSPLVFTPLPELPPPELTRVPEPPAGRLLSFSSRAAS